MHRSHAINYFGFSDIWSSTTVDDEDTEVPPITQGPDIEEVPASEKPEKPAIA